MHLNQKKLVASQLFLKCISFPNSSQLNLLVSLILIGWNIFTKMYRQYVYTSFFSGYFFALQVFQFLIVVLICKSYSFLIWQLSQQIQGISNQLSYNYSFSTAKDEVSVFIITDIQIYLFIIYCIPHLQVLWMYNLNMDAFVSLIQI